MMDFAVPGLLFVAAIVWVVQPLLGPRRNGEKLDSDSDAGRSTLLSKKQRLYRAIKDLEFDYHSGKVSESDFQEIRTSLRHEAVQVLIQLDPEYATASVDDPLEQDILRHRNARRKVQW